MKKYGQKFDCLANVYMYSLSFRLKNDVTPSFDVIIVSILVIAGACFDNCDLLQNKTRFFVSICYINPRASSMFKQVVEAKRFEAVF